MENLKKVIPVNTVFGVAKTVCAGYYKYGVQTLLTGDFGTTGTIVLEYEENDSIQHDGGRDCTDNQGAVL